MEINSPPQHGIGNMEIADSPYPPLNDYPGRRDYQSAMSSEEPYPTDDPTYVKGFEFSDESIRRGFIRKVYSLLSLQLIFSFGIVLLCTQHDGVKSFIQGNLWMFFIGFLLLLITTIVMLCCESALHKHPHNLIFLSFMTIGETICISCMSTIYNSETVLIALGMTCLCCLSLTIFAIQTKIDFTKLGGALFVALLMLVFVGIIGSFIRSHLMELILAWISLILFAIYLIHDTQMIIGGKGKYQMGPDEYILGTLSLYLDIINIFVDLLKIISSLKK
ncbi:protein lifeguard 1-like isoform X2 [Contarinia nasturtii]|nr:protein lifeguard 1-like isoform X2 [Contarinia nasturtii]XP_031622425.1 protein lifeguard 1-like isoform X2 [Contarinia nasturtii]